MTKFEKIAILLSVLFAILGLVLGLYIDGSYFARSGALIVVVGIVYGLLDLPSRLANIDSWVKKEAQRIRPEVIKEIKGQSGDDAVAERAFDQAIEETLEELDKLAKEKRKKLVFIEACILIFGTLVWGFGDFINPVYGCTS